jgi:hypothetical protein
MDNENPLDLNAVFEAIDSADVIVFRFVTIPQRLLFDSRFSATEGPSVRLVPGSTPSLPERMTSIKQARPRFRTPERVTTIRWPRYVRSFVESGAWERILRRIDDTGYTLVPERAAAVLREMEARERAEAVNAIIGAGYHSLWSRTC